ncbi:hypothetical protein [Brachybacterium fresconis]|uniref:Uncharacterized protein n=1 Tax=Brachybacterium fresconis TaxID=173363 RepID=A0ABS4YG71_9MICO|nr:hypothetical protein [Brachybacterium fresconis]
MTFRSRRELGRDDVVPPEVIPARGLEITGLHHEIYLGDPRRAAPERLRTILRQPVRNREATERRPH